MAEIITDNSQKELKKHGSDEFPLLVSYEKLSGYKSGSFLWHWHPESQLMAGDPCTVFTARLSSGAMTNCHKICVSTGTRQLFRCSLAALPG